MRSPIRTLDAFTLRDELKDAPGVFAQGRCGQELRIAGPLDFIATFAVNHSDGFRQHNRGRYEQFNANVGYRLTPFVETRFYAGAYIADKQLPGTLSLADALVDPTRTGGHTTSRRAPPLRRPSPTCATTSSQVHDSPAATMRCASI